VNYYRLMAIGNVVLAIVVVVITVLLVDTTLQLSAQRQWNTSYTRAIKLNVAQVCAANHAKISGIVTMLAQHEDSVMSPIEAKYLFGVRDSFREDDCIKDIMDGGGPL